MDNFAVWLAPLQQRISERAAYMGFLAALAVYFFALFLPWTSLPIVTLGQDPVSASGWDELAYLSVLPFAGVLLNGLPGRKPLNLDILGLCIMLSFALLLVDNVEHRTVWLTPLLIDAGNAVPHAYLGSSLDTGFWFALAAMVALSFFGLLWTLHKTGKSAVQAAASSLAGQRA